MAWKGIYLSRAAYLSLSNHNLHIRFRQPAQGEPQELSLPLEDIDYLVIDTPEVSLSSPLIGALSGSSVLLLGVDERHQPCWAAFPWASYYQQGTTLDLQLQASLPLRKQLWAHIIRQKICAQASTLELVHREREARALHAMSRRVVSGDIGNMEARAARLYWRSLWKGRPFIRHADDLPNAMLNYGYALIRAAIARSLCALGFVPQMGLHHRSKGNAFNLADDLIEPYRPFIDRRVVRLLGAEPFENALSKEHRQQLLRILAADVVMDGETVVMTEAIVRTVSGLRHALQLKRIEALKFPDEAPAEVSV